MNREQRIAIGTNWIALAKMHGRDIDHGALKLMLNVIDDLDFNQVERVMIEWAKDSKVTRHPLPGDIRDALGITKVDNKALALEATGRIMQAVRKYGEYDATAAKEFIGDLGWKLVQRFGWGHLCANLGLNLSETTFQAQARDQIEAILNLKDRGIIDQPIMLDTNRKSEQGQLEKASDIKFLNELKKNQEEKK